MTPEGGAFVTGQVISFLSLEVPLRLAVIHCMFFSHVHSEYLR